MLQPTLNLGCTPKVRQRIQILASWALPPDQRTQSNGWTLPPISERRRVVVEAITSASGISKV